MVSAASVATVFFTGLGIGLITVAFGFLMAVAAPDRSLIGMGDALGKDGIVREGLRYGVGLVQARTNGPGATIGPLLLMLIPFGMCLIAGSMIAGRADPNTRPISRVALAAWIALPFTAIMVAASIFAKPEGAEEDLFTLHSVVLLTLACGVSGAVIGGLWVIGDDFGYYGEKLVKVGQALLKPLVILLVIMGIGGLAAYEVQAVRDQGIAIGDREKVTALAENVFFSGDYAVNFAGLGMLAEQSAEGLNTPLPLDGAGAAQLGAAAGEDNAIRIFDYGDAMPGYTYVPMLFLMLALPAIFALYAGFAAARAYVAPNPGAGMSIGALTGITWAVALTAVAAIHGISSPNLFFSVLPFGAVLGLLGGLVGGFGGWEDSDEEEDEDDW